MRVAQVNWPVWKKERSASSHHQDAVAGDRLAAHHADPGEVGGGIELALDGIVIVTGRNIGVGFRSGSNTEIRGALISNETNPGEVAGYYEFLKPGRHHESAV